MAGGCAALLLPFLPERPLSMAATAWTRALLALSPFLFSASLAAAAAPGAETFASRAECMRKAEKLPNHAAADALAWEGHGGGSDARLCRAVALYWSGDWRTAAPLLESAAAEIGVHGEGKEPQASLWSMAAQAWSQAAVPDRAESAYAKALALAPTNPRLWLDRAVLRGASQRYWDVLSDLDESLRLDGSNAEAWLLRAETHRLLGLTSRALVDAGRALAIAPHQGEALLLRGNLYAHQGDFEKARKDWEAARRTSGGSGAAQAAQDNLNRLDLTISAQDDRAAKADSKP
jgi:tetratricopeptide (TPR) repeat protein